HVVLLDAGRLREQVSGLGHQRRGDSPGEMGVAPRLVREGVEDAVGPAIELHRVPLERRRLLLAARQAPAHTTLPPLPPPTPCSLPASATTLPRRQNSPPRPVRIESPLKGHPLPRERTPPDGAVAASKRSSRSRASPSGPDRPLERNRGPHSNRLRRCGARARCEPCARSVIHDTDEAGSPWGRRARMTGRVCRTALGGLLGLLVGSGCVGEI